MNQDARPVPRRGLPHRNVYATHADRRRLISRKSRYVATLAAPAAARKRRRMAERTGVDDGQFRKRRRQIRGRRGPRFRGAYIKMRGNNRSCAGTSIASGRARPWCTGAAEVMNAKLGIRDGAITAVVFGIVLFGLVSFDPRVHDRMTELLWSGSVTPWGDRIGDLVNALWSAARTQSMDNASVLIFFTVGTVLTLFMVKS